MLKVYRMNMYYSFVSGKFLSLLLSFSLYSYACGIPTNFFRTINIKNCGRSILPPKSPDRIVGGKNVEHGRHPWMASLQENADSVFEHVCGATVLNENWIITAAHCIALINDPWRYQVLVGLHKLSEQGASTVQRVKISKIIIQEKYDDDTFYNDIALLKTAKPIDISGSKGYINGICLPETDEDPSGYATVTGWGHTYEDGQNSNTLKEVITPIIPRDVCNEAYDDNPFDEADDVIETQICAGMANRDACQNDSGGPLIQINNKGVASLIGVVSNGVGCGAKNYPGIYTRVSSFKNWIQKIVTQ